MVYFWSSEHKPLHTAGIAAAVPLSGKNRNKTKVMITFKNKMSSVFKGAQKFHFKNFFKMCKTYQMFISDWVSVGYDLKCF